MAQTPGDAVTSPEIEPLDCGSSDWQTSSQKSADLYKSGAKLWTKEDLKDIEEQLEKVYTMERFSVRRIDGSILQISNPMFQVQNPIWKPIVVFQEYWTLVKSRPNGPIETYHCSYLIKWENHIVDEHEELMSQPKRVFDEKALLWQNSVTRKQLTAMVRNLLGTNTVKKVVCFGLGDFCAALPEWLRANQTEWDEANDIQEATNPIIQHSMAQTIAQLCCGDEPVPLLTQDPAYTTAAEEILTQKGFKIVGRHGAGGFAEIDDESIVISVIPSVPVKQIIADLGRPALIICTGESTFSSANEPYDDAESPRSKQMLLDHYEPYNIPVHFKDTKISSALGRIRLYRRRQQPLDSQGALEPEFTGLSI